MNKAVIFDLDGTLIHSLPDICENINYMLEHFGYDLVSEDKLKNFIGTGARNLVRLSIGKEISEQELDERLSYYNTFYTASPSDKTVVFDGVAQVLTALKERGYKLVILTNKPQETTDRVYEKHLKRFGFDKVIGQSGTVKCKPDKTATLKILSDLEVIPENAYFVGDGETDVITSINAGTKGIAVLWGYRDKEQLAKAGATVFAKTPSNLLDLIK